MSDIGDCLEKERFSRGRYVSCGEKRGVEILRYEIPDGRKPGVISRYSGGLLTARHVVEALGMTGFRLYGSESEIPDIDLAYKPQPNSMGLKLGYTDSMAIFGAEIIGSDMDKPDKLAVIKGNVTVGLMPTNLKWFSFSNFKDKRFFKPGISGSPIVYSNHIIGVVPYGIHLSEGEVPVVAFMGTDMKRMMKDFGLELEKVD